MTAPDYAREVADWPPLTDEAKARLEALLRSSGKGLKRIGQDDVDEVLDGIRGLAEVS